MARRSGRMKKAPATHTRGVLRDRSASRAPSEGVKHVRIRSPTPIGLPPSLNDIVGEASPERAEQTSEMRCPSPITFSGVRSSIHNSKGVLKEVPESQRHQDSELKAGSAFGTAASSSTESDEEDSMAMFIVGECEDVSEPPGPSGTRPSSEFSITSPAPRRDSSASLSKAASSATYAATDTDESADLIVGEVAGEKDLPQTWRSISVGSDSSQSGSSSDCDTPSHQHSALIIGEADVDDNLLVDWESQSEDEGMPVSSPSAESDASSPNIAMLIVGEAEDSDLDSPPQSSMSQSDRGMGESSSNNKSSTSDENSDDPNTPARDPLTLTPVPGTDDATIEYLSFDFSVEASPSSPAPPASPLSTQRHSSPPDSISPSSSYMKEIDVKVNTAHHLSQLRSERQEVADALEEISNTEETALSLQSSAFSTHPQYWRAYQLSLWIRTTEVNNAWDQLVQH